MDNGVDALQCDVCVGYTDETQCTPDTCVWVPTNTDIGGSCMNKCSARTTLGECGQYHEWNKSELSPVIYDFSGSDDKCLWHPHSNSQDFTHDSVEGTCRAKDSPCFDTTDFSPVNGGDCQNGGEPINLKDGKYCYTGSPLDGSSLGEVYCGYYYSGHGNRCYNQKDVDNCGDNCTKYVDPRIYDLPSDQQDKGICVSDGAITYDLETGENMGLLMTDEACGDIKDGLGCMDYNGYGCLWEPFDEYCVPTVPQPTANQAGPDEVTVAEMFNSCKPIDGHLPGGYDVNMLEEEDINVSEYRDRNNKKYPYYTSKYLCDICHIRNNDLDHMRTLEDGIGTDGQGTDDQGADEETLKYYMIKKYVDFGKSGVDRATTISSTPQQYCEREIDDTHDVFNPCMWSPGGDSEKGGQCESKCSQNSPVDTSVQSSQDLKSHKDQCVSDKWYPESSVRDIPFPNILRGDEAKDDYFNDRYCTWDGFECHNSIPCKFAQQTRCEDLGYEWYEGTALDIMNQSPSTDKGIPLDLSSSYPIERKGDGKPVEGDIEGVCIYPNIEAGFVNEPATYMINPEFIGEQVIMIKW